MRYVPMLVLTALPLALWPSLWTFFVVLNFGLPIARATMPYEIPAFLAFH